MVKPNRNVTVPLQLHPGFLYFALAFAFPAGLLITAMGLIGLFSFSVPLVLVSLLIAIPLGLLFLGCSTTFLGAAAASVEFSQEAVTLSAFGRQLRRIPVQALCGFYAVQIRIKGGFTWHLGISDLDIPALAQLRECQMEKGLFSRHDLPFMKRKGDWKTSFAKAYLLRSAHSSRDLGFFGKIIWMEYSGEMLALLRHLYPDIPVEVFSEKGPYENGCWWEDPEPKRFCRGFLKPNGSRFLPFLIILLIFLFPIGLLLTSEEATLYILLYTPVLIALFVGLLFLQQNEGDVFTLLPKEICIQRGKKSVQIPVSGIHLILCRLDSTVNPDIRLCLKDRASCIAEQTAWLQKSRRRMLLQAIQLLPDRDHWLCIGYCKRRRLDLGKELASVQSLMYTPERAQTLREMYPDIPWVEESCVM